MKNGIKSFLVVLMIGIISMLGISSVNAVPNSISGVNHDELISFEDGPNLYYKHYNGGVAFCTTFMVQGVGSSCTVSSSQWNTPIASGIAAIIEKYNAAPSKQNYYNAELAINKFLYDYEKDPVNNIRTVSGSTTFYDAAVNAYNEAKKNFDITLNTDKLTFKLEGDKYISNKVTVSGSEKYTITVSGVEGVSYEQKGNDFYVTVPSTSVKDGETVNVDAKVSGSKTIKIAKKYECGSGNQNVTINDYEKSDQSKDTIIKGNITKEKQVTKLKISKQDISSKKELPGATLTLLDEKGNEIDKWVSETEPHYVENLKPGKYKLIEVQAPNGYKLTEEIVEFVLEANNKVTEVVMYNVKEEYYKVKISKQDISTKTELPGATLVLKNSKGEEIDRWVSGTEPHYLELKKGEYTLTEIQAPNGYDLSYEVIKFSVGDNGEVETSVVMYNSKTPDTAGRNVAIVITIMAIAGAAATFAGYKLKHQK